MYPSMNWVSSGSGNGFDSLLRCVSIPCCCFFFQSILLPRAEERNNWRKCSYVIDMSIFTLSIYAAMLVGAECSMILTPISSHCQRTQNCRGVWFDDEHSDLVSQTGLCPAEPSTLNDGLKQDGFYFTVKETIAKGIYYSSKLITTHRHTHNTHTHTHTHTGDHFTGYFNHDKGE